MDPATLTATEARARILAGALSPVALMEACLARIAAREPEIRAMAFLDPRLALQGARAAIAGGGRLHGLPIAVKDVLDTADMPSEYNSPIWRGHRPRADAAAVAWSRAEGGVVLGKTVTTEFATRQPGPTANPHDLRRTPGGSSSGSAAGVAAGFFPLAFGTQTAGSVVRPAAYCGIVGYKPSFGLISRVGMKLMAGSLDTVGVMARSVADCALLAGAVSGRDLGDPDRRLGRVPRIGLCRSPAWEHAAPETQAMLQNAAACLARAGAALADVALPSEFDALEQAHPVVMHAESARSLSWELLHHRDQLSEGLRERMEWGLSQPPEVVDDARAVFVRTQRAFPSAMAGYDVLVTPAAAGEAPIGLGWTGDPVFNAVWTSLHVPCVTVPAGTGPNAMPLGLQIVGRIGEDRDVLAWAQWIAAALT